ncbi:hypothetical protein R84981_001138 [Carnimonas sp. R-84981]|uniref:hypothetical protein n=1 Tax=Carnimonas bestiolae TaxID=3402172 RepID=UPI003EDC349B
MKKTAALIISLLFSSSSFAAWKTDSWMSTVVQFEKPVRVGNAALYYPSFEDSGIVFDCVEDTPFFSVIFLSPGSDDIENPSVPGMKIVLSSKDDYVDFKWPEMKRRNSQYVQVSGEFSNQVNHALYMLRNAKEPLSLSYVIGGKRGSIRVPVDGSTKASDKFIKVCDLNVYDKSWLDMDDMEH